MEHGTHWWQHGIIYQIYPRSFMDANGDGIGDLAGIVQRLDYLQWLGVDAIWISPIYPSPMADFGYDISDYCAIHPLFGSLADFDRLVAEAHRRDLRVILDFVPNHSSDQHPWFLASRSSRSNPRRDWYIWRDPAPGGGPPNNWRSVFGGSAWEWDAATGQYYYHAYLKEQPDLNWRNPEVQRAMFDVLRFWLERGVDGFRVDALRQIIKDQSLRANPPNPDWCEQEGPYQALLPVYTTDRPEVLDLVARMRQVLDEYGDRVLIGELYLPIERLVAYYGSDGNGCHLPFNFHLIGSLWNATDIAALVEAYEAALPPFGWPNWVLGNHDKPRLASRIGAAQTRVAAVLLLTLRGTPTLYNGDEIGMHDVPIPADQVQDPWERNVPGLGLGRDPERTPMQWNAGPNAGFSKGRPWLPLAADWSECNVAAQQDDRDSLLALYQRLIRLRCSEPALALGSYRAIASAGDVLAYLREYNGRRFLIALNFGPRPQDLAMPQLELRGSLILSTRRRSDDLSISGGLTLAGDEALIALLDPD